MIISARLWEMMRVFLSSCIEKEKKSQNSGTGSYDLHNEHGKDTYKEARLRWQKNITLALLQDTRHIPGKF